MNEMPIAGLAVPRVDAGSLSGRLAGLALSSGVLDIGYAEHDTMVGRLVLCATEVGVVRVGFADAEGGTDTVLQSVADTVSPRILRAPARIDVVRREIDEYLAGHRRDFSVTLDLRMANGFRREVLDALPRVEYGHTVTYTALALDAGRPKAVRAAASACANNPVPLLLPCHRVVRADGGLGGYLGGVEAKQLLLALEQPTVQYVP